MAKAVADQIEIRIGEETTVGTAPATDVYTIYRTTGESLRQETASVNSAELRTDRQIAEVVRTNINAAGDLNYELSYGASANELHETLMAAALFDAGWSTAQQTSGGISATASPDKFTHSSFVGQPFGKGTWIKVAGAANEENNGIFKVSQTVAPTETDVQIVARLDPTLANGSAWTSLVTETLPTVATLDLGAEIVNGTSERSFTIERTYTDLTTEIARYVGMEVNTWNQNFSADAIITGTFGFIGMSGSSVSANAYATAEPAPTGTVFNAVDHVDILMEGYGTTGIAANSFTFTLNNNIRTRNTIGTLGPESFGAGTVDLTGTLQMFFEDRTIMDKYLNWTATSLAIGCTDTAGNTLIFDFPRARYTSGQRVAGGQNTDIIADMNFSAYRDPNETYTVRVIRFPAS